MAASWVPDEGVLIEICEMLQKSQTATTELHQSIYHRLEELAAYPQFGMVLVYILVHEERATVTVRAAAGLLLKRSLTPHKLATLDSSVLDYIKSQVVMAINDPNSLVQSTAGIIVTTIISVTGLESWPGLLEGLSSLLASDEPTVVLGTMVMLRKMCEDSPEELHDFDSGRALGVLMGQWLQLFLSADQRVRRHAVSCINAFIQYRSAGLLAIAEQFVDGLFHLTEDPTVVVSRAVCEGLVLMLKVRPDLFLERMDRLIEYMLHCSASADELLALEACEFWSSFGEFAIAKDLISPHLPVLVPVLLRNMIYSDSDLMLLESIVETDAQEPDRAQDIEPRHHRSSALAGAAHHDGGDDDSNDDDDDGDGDGEDDEELDAQAAADMYVEEWNLRKSAAASLDVLARLYGAALLELFMPAVTDMMNSPQWTEREAGILAIGAIAFGCSAAMEPYLPSILSHLITNCLVDERALIRKIACWAASRYSEWVVWQGDPATYLGPFTEAIVGRMLDGNKLVQEAACSAFAILCEKATTELVEFYPGIMSTIAEAMGFYQVRNLRLLYDAVGTLCENSGGAVEREDVAERFLPALMGKFMTTALTDQCLFPLMEALTTAASTTKACFIRYAEPTVLRCAEMLTETLAQIAEFEAQGFADEDMPCNKEYIVCALDLLSGVADAAQSEMTPLLEHVRFVEMLPQLMLDQSPDVKQSTYAFVGDIAKWSPGILAPVIDGVMPLLSDSLVPQLVSVCNNAGWAIGELALQFGTGLDHYLPAIVPKLVACINRPNTNRNLVENMAIALGRIGIHSPALAAPYLEAVVHNWCLAMRSLVDDDEKASAFRGFCNMIMINPDAVVARFILVCDAIASWRDAPEDLHDIFHQIIYAFKGSLAPELWAQFYANMPVELRRILHEQYMLS